MPVGYRLPISGADVALRPPCGTEDLLLAEAVVLDVALAVELAASLARPALDWWSLPGGDLEACLLALRRMVFGELVRSHARCAAPGCGERIDVAFTIGEYLRHHAPRRPRSVQPAGDSWMALDGLETRFRSPTVADQHAASLAAEPRAFLAGRCIDGPVSRRACRRIEAALEALAPCFADDLAGACPECGAAVLVPFDPIEYVLCELRDQAMGIYRDVDLLASRYGWGEAEILALPAGRRLRYAALAMAERSPS